MSIARLVFVAAVTSQYIAQPSIAQDAITASGFTAAWGTSNPQYDLNGDGVVNGADLTLFLAQIPPDSGGQSSSGSGTVTPIVTAPLLIPGTGFTSSTPQPSSVGDSSIAGFDAKAIARWDAVPYEEFSGDTYIGVVAFHINGIESVKFSANGGAWTAIAAQQKNPMTNVVEYFVKLRAQDFPVGATEIRAIITPSSAGVPRVLQGSFDLTRPNGANAIAFRDGMHSMFVQAQPAAQPLSRTVWVSAASGNDTTGNGSSSSPFATITRAATRVDAANNGADGCTVMLMAGDYSITPPYNFPGPTNKVRTIQRWLTVRAADGLAPSQVRITGCSPGGLGTRLLKVKGVTLYQFAGLRTNNMIDSYLWVDQCKVTSSTRYVETNGALAANGWSAVWATQCEAFETRHSLRAATFVRDCSVHQFTLTPFGGDATILNCKVDEYTQYQNDHADVVHWFWTTPAARENRIVYGLKASRFVTQGFFAEPRPTGAQRLDNVAIVDVHVSQDNECPAGCWWQLDTNHLLLWNLQLPDQPWRMWTHLTQDIGGQLLITNSSMRNSIFFSLHGAQIPQGANVRHIHLLNPTHQYVIPQGTDVTCGWIVGGTTPSSIFMNPAEFDYRVKLTSVAAGRVPSDESLGAANLGSTAGTAPSTPLPLGAFVSVLE